MSRLRFITTALLAAAVTFLLYAAAHHTPSTPRADVARLPEGGGAPERLAPEPPAPAGPITTVHTIQRGETMGAILLSQGAPVTAVLAAAQPHVDLSRILAGDTLSFIHEPDDPVPTQIRYALDQDSTLVISRDADRWTADVDVVVYERRTATREFSVQTSLWAAAEQAGLSPADIATLAKVYEYDIDFNTEVRAGATVRMVVPELWLDDTLVRLGAPSLAVFDNAGHEYVAVRFEDDDGHASYYDADGVSRKKAFLRSPLPFSHVTSGFSLRRFHPVLKKARPHYGTDFGAPTGTPVRAVGEGRVTWAARNGGHGNYVKIDHPGPYQSSYSHLSKIKVKKGQSVHQGQIIGLVGATGITTGPHLHFQFWVNGKFVDPLTVELPRETRLKGATLARFNAERDQLMAALSPAPEAPPAGDTPIAELPPAPPPPQDGPYDGVGGP